MQASEEQEQIAVLDWLRLKHPWLVDYVIHIKNERKTTLRRGGINKRMGVRKGASDLFLCFPTLTHYGLFIEMKSKRGKPTSEQLAFIDLVKNAGYYGKVCYGAQDAIDTITDYLKTASLRVR